MNGTNNSRTDAASSGRLQEVKNSDQQLPPRVVAMGELVVY